MHLYVVILLGFSCSFERIVDSWIWEGILRIRQRSDYWLCHIHETLWESDENGTRSSQKDAPTHTHTLQDVYRLLDEDLWTPSFGCPVPNLPWPLDILKKLGPKSHVAFEVKAKVRTERRNSDKLSARFWIPSSPTSAYTPSGLSPLPDLLAEGLEPGSGDTGDSRVDKYFPKALDYCFHINSLLVSYSDYATAAITHCFILVPA